MLRETEVAARLGLAVSTLRVWRWAGKGPAFVKLGTAVRYRPEDVEDFVRKGFRATDSTPAMGQSSAKGGPA